MVQFCCGSGDCAAAGIPNQSGARTLTRSAKFGQGFSSGVDFISSTAGGSGGSGGGMQSLRIAVNGTEIEPLYVGPPQVPAEQQEEKEAEEVKREEVRSALLLSRDSGACKGDWTPDAGYEDYTRPSDGPQIVSSLAKGPVTVSITDTRTQEWSQTVETSLGFADILSLGVSFSSTFSESLSNAQTVEYQVDAGISGYVGWTSFLRCSRGMFMI